MQPEKLGYVSGRGQPVNLLQDINRTLYHSWRRQQHCNYRHKHGILFIVLQVVRLAYETLAEASYDDTTAYTGKLPKASILIANIIGLGGQVIR